MITKKILVLGSLLAFPDYAGSVTLMGGSEPSSTPKSEAKMMVSTETQKSAVVHSDKEPSLSRFILAKGVEHREPVNPTDTFSEHDGRVYIFVECVPHGNDHIKIVWKHAGHEHFSFVAKMDSHASRWRTHSYVTARAGDWTVSVIDPAGHTLKEIVFHVSKDEFSKSISVVEPLKAPDEKIGVGAVLKSLEPTDASKRS